MAQTEEEPKDFRDSQILDISQMTDQQKVHLVSYYLGELANYYNDGARHLAVDANALLRPLKAQLYRKEQEVLTLRVHVLQVLEARIAGRLSQVINQALLDPDAAREQGRQRQEEAELKGDLDILQRIQRDLRALLGRWEGRHPLQAKVVRAMLELSGVPFGGMADVPVP